MIEYVKECAELRGVLDRSNLFLFNYKRTDIIQQFEEYRYNDISINIMEFTEEAYDLKRNKRLHDDIWTFVTKESISAVTARDFHAKHFNFTEIVELIRKKEQNLKYLRIISL